MNKRTRFINVALALATSAIAALITVVLASEFGWAKFFAWTIFFIALQTPIVFSSKYSYADCTAWLRKKNM